MKPNVALSLMRLGYSEALAGRFEQAERVLHESVGVFDELGETTWTSVAHRYLGLLALLDGRIDDAEFLLRTSLYEGRERAPQFDLPYWIEELAAVAVAKGETERAATLWGATDALFENSGLAVLEGNRQVRERFRDVAGGLDDDTHVEGCARGRAMTLQHAITSALTDDTVATIASPPQD